jgi:predicted flavoprotein YhiN
LHGRLGSFAISVSRIPKPFLIEFITASRINVKIAQHGRRFSYTKRTGGTEDATIAVSESAEVLVVGASLAGLCAAYSSAREGADTLLVDAAPEVGARPNPATLLMEPL